MPWYNRTVLLTGAGGFIGSHLTEALIDAGAKVKAFLYYNSSNCRGNLKQLDPDKMEAIEISFGDISAANLIPKDTPFDIPDLAEILLSREEKIASYTSNDLWIDMAQRMTYRKLRRLT